ncbi:polysaccharide deacetylase family protein [Cohnella panacarvi]|uniref:polysaccharide deacetylase family protein n=1 Tax=Cohnella panacarvi TaxID=400776 RepID=UPI00047A7BC1|nr:polysaccharide deacetylase family protein [Cohnella panacarvi]
MRGTRTRARFSRSRRTTLRLFAALLIAATIFGLSAIQLSGRMTLGNDAVPEAAAAAIEPPAGIEPAPDVPTSIASPAVPGPEREPAAQPPPDASPKPRPPIPPPPAADSGKEDARKLIALTFDDGPDGKYTPQVLDILKERGAKGTFFLVGPQVSKYPDTAKRILDEGHSIGNHSWSHKDLKTMTPEQIADEVDRTQQEIADATGYTPHLMRAPYGNISPNLLDALRERDMAHVYWTIDTRDWAGTSVADMRKNVSAHAQPGSILLMHSFGGRKNALDNTLALLPQIIDDLSNEGFAFVTVDELIESGQTRKSVIKH